MSFKDIKKRLIGPHVAVPTPLNKNYDIDEDGFRQNLRFLVDNGIVEGKAVIMAVTAAGECPSLTIEERKRAMKVVADEVKDKVPLVTSVQDCSIDNVIRLAKYAKELGFDVVQLSPPWYWDTSKDEVFRFYKYIAEKIDIGIMLYNTTWLGVLSGVGIDAELMERLSKIDKIIAVKWSSPDYYTFIEVLEKFHDKYAFMDNQYHGLGRLFGATSMLGIVGNFYPRYILEVWELIDKGRVNDWRKKIWEFEIPFYQWVTKVQKAGYHGEGVILKTGMRLIGLAGGKPKPPYDHELPKEFIDELRDIMIKAKVPGVK